MNSLDETFMAITNHEMNLLGKNEKTALSQRSLSG